MLKSSRSDLKTKKSVKYMHNVHRDFAFPEINPFNFFIYFSEVNSIEHTVDINFHTHKEFEIYINLTGDVAFIVGSHIYPLSRGDIIISRPGEPHHCVYRSEANHGHYCIHIDCEKNPSLFEYFFKNSASNYISPDEAGKNRLLNLCDELISKDYNENNLFFDLATLLSIVKEYDNSTSAAEVSEELSKILRFINDHITEDISLSRLEKEFFISKSSIERKFCKFIDMKPTEFIRKRKLLYAAELLKKGASVLEAGNAVSYFDTSYFIKIFKNYFGVTPLKYRNSIKAKN